METIIKFHQGTEGDVREVVTIEPQFAYAYMRRQAKTGHYCRFVRVSSEVVEVYKVDPINNFIKKIGILNLEGEEHGNRL